MLPPPPIVPDPYANEFMAGPGAPGDDYYQYEPTQDSQWGSSVRIFKTITENKTK
jgi:hypothetical protein